MSKKELTSFAIIATGFLSIIYPIIVWYSQTTLSFDASLTASIFPVLGLIAFSFMWIHLISWPLHKMLAEYVPIQRFNDITSTIVLVLILLHPILLGVTFGFSYLSDIFSYGNPIFIWFGISGLTLLLTYDLEKMFRKHHFFVRNKRIIDFASILGFFIILFHSLMLGGNLQTGALRYVWIFYGSTALCAVVMGYRTEFSSVTQKQ